MINISALKCEFDMFSQKAFTAHGKWHDVYNSEQYIMCFVLLGPYCNGHNSSCQVSLFSHVCEPCSTRWRVNPVIWRQIAFFISLQITLHDCTFITSSLVVAKNWGLLKMRLSVRCSPFFFSPKCVISGHVSVGRVAVLCPETVDWWKRSLVAQTRCKC